MSEKSFSMRVKEEACQVLPEARHCQIAELAGLLIFCGVSIREDSFEFYVDNSCAKNKIVILLERLFDVKPVVEGCKKRHTGNKHYSITVKEAEKGYEIMETTKLADEMRDEAYPVDPIVYQRTCCKRAFIRGCFLAAGSVINPEKSYHLEIVCFNRKAAEAVCSCINSFRQDDVGMEAKIIERKRIVEYSGIKDCERREVVYLKEGDQIADFLNICETFKCLMELENIRVKKEIANSLNRKQNCEMANMVKTINAAQEQKDDILVIQKYCGLNSLPDELLELAVLRLEDTEITMKELGERLTPPIGKSGVNHRFRRIHRIAEKIREKL